MAESNWTDCAGSSLDTATIDRGVSAAFTRPSGGGSMLFGMRTLVSAAGAGGMYYNASGFAPFTGSRKGGSISGCIKRFSSSTKFAPYLALLTDTDLSSAQGYMVALTQESSYKIGLFKGNPAAGFSATAAACLASSSASFTDVGDAAAAWFQLKLDVIVNPHGEVVLNVFRNDLNTNFCTAPSWEAVAGLSQFIDDSLGHFSGTSPHLDGFYGHKGMYTNGQAGDLALYDQIVVSRQTAP